jgi:2-octaprenyl-6-methoxyphenol hydroxylase
MKARADDADEEFPMADRFDVAIVGGGHAGLALGLALARAMDGLEIAILDRRPFTVPKDQRAFAIATGVRRVFEALGIWDDIAEVAQPIRRMEITDSGTGDLSRPLFLNFSGDVAPGEPFAHMVPNAALTNALLTGIAGRAELIAPAEITAFSGDGPTGRLILKDGRTVSAPLVVAADGGMSALRAMAGIGTIAHDYKQAGIVTTIRHELPHEGVAYEHFRPSGPSASLPLKPSEERGNRSSLVWTESREAAERYKAMPLDEVAAVIEEVMGSSLGAVTVEEPLQTFPLSLRLARTFIAPRLALIGDAAHVVHPVAGQGLNLGLKDVAALTEVIVEAMRLGLDHGTSDVLAKYERWRRFDTALMALVTDVMNRLFSNDVAPVRALRDFGLGLVDRARPIKDMMVERAAGIDHNGPRLLRGLPV